MENFSIYKLIVICVISMFIGCIVSYYVIRISVSDALANINKTINEINNKLDKIK